MSNPLRKLVPGAAGRRDGRAAVGGARPSARPSAASTTSCIERDARAAVRARPRDPRLQLRVDRFLQPGNLSLIVQQVMVVGTLGIAQTLVILTAGIDLSVGAIMVLSLDRDGQAGGRLGPAGPARPADRLRRRHARAAAQRGAHHPPRLPPFIVTLGTLNIFFALNLATPRARPSAAPTCRALLLCTGNTSTSATAVHLRRRSLMLVLFAVFAYVLKQHRLGPPRLRRRRRRRVRPPGGHPHRAGRCSRLRRRRPDLRLRGLELIGRIASASPQAGRRPTSTRSPPS